jgi:hypothetical protein
MIVTIIGLATALQDQVEIPPAPTAMRSVARVLLAVLIVTLVSYIVIEQIGTWRRRRSGRD